MDSGPWNSTNENAADPFAADQAKANEVRPGWLRRMTYTFDAAVLNLRRCMPGLRHMPATQRHRLKPLGFCGWVCMHPTRPTRFVGVYLEPCPPSCNGALLVDGRHVHGARECFEAVRRAPTSAT